MPTAIIDQLNTYGPDHCDTLDYEQAVTYTRELAQSHYENFSVVSWFLPKRLRDDFHHVYAFCRWADDLGDEISDEAKSLELLAWWRSELDQCYQGRPHHPVYVALWPTIQKHDIPREPFDHLIDAFVQDQKIKRYDTFGQVLDYCRLSADPVGRLVLYLCGYRDARRQSLSDATCTALQLANHWQDVRRDIVERDRVYIPEQVARAHGLDIDFMVDAVRIDHEGGPACRVCGTGRVMCSPGLTAILPEYRATLRDLVGQTTLLFEKGRALLPLLSTDVRTDVKLFTLGGEAIIKMIKRQNYSTMITRPKLTAPGKIMLMMRAVIGRVVGVGS